MFFARDNPDQAQDPLLLPQPDGPDLGEGPTTFHQTVTEQEPSLIGPRIRKTKVYVCRRGAAQIVGYLGDKSPNKRPEPLVQPKGQTGECPQQ